MAEQTSKHLDSRLRATRIAKEIVFEESINPESRQLQCCMDRIDRDITESCSTGRRIEECEEIHCGGLHIPVSLKKGALEFTIGGVQFKIHRSVTEDDAVRCAETILKLSREDDDIGTMENPVIEMGTKGTQGEKEVAVTEILSGKIRFHKHKTGRLWACAIDEVTKSKGREYLHMPLELLARHGFWHMLVINPEIQNIGLEIAKCLGRIRANPDKRKREIAVKELLLIADGLNPHYSPGKASDWKKKLQAPRKPGSPRPHVSRFAKGRRQLGGGTSGGSFGNPARRKPATRGRPRNAGNRAAGTRRSLPESRTRSHPMGETSETRNYPGGRMVSPRPLCPNSPCLRI